MGFDDIALCEYLTPQLTTVHQPLARMAGEAVRLALAGGEREVDGRAPRVELATHLVERASTARPPAT